MFSAFVVILGLTGDPIGAAQSQQQFPTMEACETWEKNAGSNLVQSLQDKGVEFKEVKSKCVEDIGQSASDVFGLKKPENEGPSPEATAPRDPIVPVPPPQ